MSWSAPNYRLVDAYINNSVDERDNRRNPNAFAQSYAFNGNGLRGSDNEFKHKIREILAQPDYNQPREVTPETITDKIDRKDEYIQDRFDEQKREMLIKQRDSLSDDSRKNHPINPYIPTLPVVQPYIVKRVSSPLDSMLTTTVLVIIGVLLCFLLIRALFSTESPEPRQVVGNMNLDGMVSEIEQNDNEN